MKQKGFIQHHFSGAGGNSKSGAGFTLIELLVVISIIGLLAAVILVSMNTARAKSRDAKRLADRRQLITAFNLYYNANGTWPNSGGAGDQWACLGPSSISCRGGAWNGSDAFITLMQPYLSAFPTNNASGSTAAAYLAYVGPTGVHSAGDPVGAYLLWFQEKGMTTSICPSWDGTTVNGYQECWEYLGAK